MSFDINKLSINKNIPIPLYYQLKTAICSQINSNNLQPDDSLPTELEITDALGISRSTVRQAIIELVNEGYLYREKGKGTFIAKPKIEASFFQKLDSFNQEMIDKGFVPSTQVLDLCVIQGQPDINKKLMLPEQDELIYLSRLRFADKDPVVFLETYLPYKNFESLIHEDYTVTSLYSVLENTYFCRIEHAVRRIDAVPANAQEAKLLLLKLNSPVMLVRTVAYADHDMPIEYSIARYRGDRNTFTVELKR